MIRLLSFLWNDLLDDPLNLEEFLFFYMFLIFLVIILSLSSSSSKSSLSLDSSFKASLMARALDDDFLDTELRFGL